MAMNRIQLQPGLSMPAFLRATGLNPSAQRHWSTRAGRPGFVVRAAMGPPTAGCADELTRFFSAINPALKYPHFAMIEAWTKSTHANLGPRAGTRSGRW